MKIIGKLLLAALVVAVVCFFAAPAVGFFAIRSAADSNDVQGLARLIDYGAVRQSLRPQLSGDPAARVPPPSFLEDPIGAVRRQLDDAAPPLVAETDAYLTPSALAALSRGEGRASVRLGAVERDPLPTPVYWSVNRARMAVADEAGARTIFTFERRGPFEWKLVHIGLPEPARPAPRRN